MRKYFVVPLMLFTAVVFAGAVWAARGGTNRFEAKFKPVPGVTTKAKGTTTFEVSKDGEVVHYEIRVADLNDVSMIHIHKIVDGKPGEILAWLYPATQPPVTWMGKYKGVLAAGVITKDQLEGSLKGKPVGDLVNEIRKGEVEVAVHTKEHPDGELLGPIKSM